MQNITSIAGLKNAIQLLEIEQALKEQILKEQVYFIRESLRPINLIKSTLRDITSSPNLIDNVLGAAVGLATGFISKKIAIGTSSNILRRLFGSILQFGVSNVVANHPDGIKSLGHYVFQYFLGKKNKSE